jgi:hypothetical protein
LNTLKKILKWIYNYTATVAAIGIGLFFFIHQFERPNLKTADKIITLEGNVTNFSFNHKAGYKANLKQYYIWLDNYPCTFQIKADFLSYFYQSRFESEIKPGDKIKLSIPKEFENQLRIRDKNVFIFSISKDSTDYLSLNETVSKENSNFDIYAGIFFVIFGGAYYVLKKRKMIK